MAKDGSRVFEGYAAAFRGLVPELLQLSLHDPTGQAVWMSADYLRPEDHALVSEAIQEFTLGHFERDYVVRDDARILAAMNLPGTQGGTRGVALLELAAVPREGWPLQRLAERLEAVLACLGFEFERQAPGAATDAASAASSPGASASRPGDPAVLALLDAALAAGEPEARDGAAHFDLFLQPILPLQAELELLRFEVLLRLRTAAGVLLAPAAFLPVAARHERMPEIDRWVVSNLIAWLTTYRRRWFRIPSVFAINVAGATLRESGFVDFLEACVGRGGVPPQALCIEISVESALAGSADIGVAARRLEALGCTVAIDDFGRDDLAFGYLRGCPAQYLKIDRALVGAAHRDRVAGAVVSGIVRMAQALGAKTVAESIESEVELDAMRTLGVDFAQGYLLGHPQALQGIDFSAARHAVLEQLGPPRH